jgi:hypothetical protein
VFFLITLYKFYILKTQTYNEINALEAKFESLLVAINTQNISEYKAEVTQDKKLEILQNNQQFIQDQVSKQTSESSQFSSQVPSQFSSQVPSQFQFSSQVPLSSISSSIPFFRK